MSIDSQYLPLQNLYQHEQQRPDAIYMVQPLGGDRLEQYSWARTVDEARRLAAYLKAKDLPAGSTISIISKNCAEFIIADFAIWMAGHVASPIYPTLDGETINYILTHSESRLLFVGKLDNWEKVAPAVPEQLPRVAFSLAPPTDYPKWADIVADTEPIEGRPTLEELLSEKEAARHPFRYAP